ncbi:tRNA pseudouridine(55) synthase TruB [Arachidicoccus soli]|uniref:tRNA pseudouridine synthase B n=1 Tax=Arachidicoccus soli TaxID=2341117 RepID=A0A386HPJ0_9BACT|nr:tRNA pseudouridine(55) synthase TruB [Arachidicoccus soli]AYD47857.1 tRNA pseudouridine(55) synthase TruB [Arachidicoccus soli]
MRQKPIHPAMQPFLDGKVILLNKSLEWTSFDAVKKIRILTGVSKVGHAGTLDPLATGLLIICTGAFTKKINEYMAQEKEYTGSITLGATTPTYDLESVPENFKDIAAITEQAILDATHSFKGEIYQIPPIHSAIKQNGKPVYLAARRGEDIKLEPRKITINEFEITEIALPKVYFRVVCSTGTYIRTLANDFGKALGVGGHLSALCRTKIGDFSVKDAYSIESFAEEINNLKTQS